MHFSATNILSEKELKELKKGHKKELENKSWENGLVSVNSQNFWLRYPIDAFLHVMERGYKDLQSYI